MSTGGGDNIEVGGISASIDLNTSQLAANLKKAEAALKATGQQIKELEAYIVATGGKVGQFDAALKELNVTKMALVRQVGQLRQEIKEEGTAAQTATGQVQALSNSVITLDASAVKATGGMRAYRGATHSAMVISQDMATGGVGGLVPAFERLGYSMSMIQGLAPMMAVGVGASMFLIGQAVKLLMDHWDELAEKWDIGVPRPALDGLEAIQERLEEINKELDKLKGKRLNLPDADKLEKLRDEKHKLIQDEKDTKEFSSITEGPSKGQKSRGDAFKEAVREIGGVGELVSALAKGANEAGLVLDQQSLTMMKPEELAKKETIRAGEGDEGAIGRITEALQEDAGGTFLSPLANKIGDLSPARKEQEENDKKREEERKKADKEATDASIREGQNLLHRGERKNRMDDEAAKSRDEEMNAATAGWDPKTMKGRAGLRREASQRVGEAEEDLPGTGKMAEAGTAALMARGASPEQAAEMIGAQVAKALEKAGMTPEEAKAASVDVAAKAGHDVKEKITKKALDDKGAEAKASETFKAEDLQNRLQAGVGGDKKKMSIEDASIQALADKFKANGLRWNVV